MRNEAIPDIERTRRSRGLERCGNKLRAIVLGRSSESRPRTTLRLVHELLLTVDDALNELRRDRHAGIDIGNDLARIGMNEQRSYVRAEWLGGSKRGAKCNSVARRARDRNQDFRNCHCLVLPFECSN